MTLVTSEGLLTPAPQKGQVMSELVNVVIDEKRGWGVIMKKDDARKLGMKSMPKVENKSIEKPDEDKAVEPTHTEQKRKK